MGSRLQVVRCGGLRPETLGDYLAGLGLLAALTPWRPGVRACWREGCLTLAGAGLDAGELTTFLRDQWQPTPYERWWKGKKVLGPERSTATLAQVRLLDCHIVSRGTRNVYNPVLGSGGNVGRRDFQQVAAACVALRSDAKADAWLEHTLWGRSDVNLPDLPSTGTWFAHANKAFNSGSAVAREGQLSPWSFLLALEGAVLLSGSVNRRLSVVARPYGAFPFVTEAPAPGEAGELGVARAEFWAPDWGSPATLLEVRDLLQRGLARVGWRAARTPADFATAAMTAGAQAGLTGFYRFVLRQTTSGNTYESIGAGHIGVGTGLKEAAALQRLANWADGLPRDEASQSARRFAGAKGPVERALLTLAERPEERESWQALLLTAADVQLRVDRNRSLRENAPVLNGLHESLWRRGWPDAGAGHATAADVARAIASWQASPCPLFENVYGATRNAKRFGSEMPAAVVWSGGTGYTVLADILERRLIDASSEPGAADEEPPRMPAQPEWIDDFLTGAVEADEVTRLLPAFVLVDWTTERSNPRRRERRAWSAEYRLQALFRPLFRTEELGPAERGARPEPRPRRARAVLSAIRGGNWARALDVAGQAYRSASLRVVQLPEIDADGERIAAALLIPLAPETAWAEFERLWLLPERDKER